MNADDQCLFVIRSVENANVAPLRKAAGGAPEKIVGEFLGAGSLEAENLATLRVDTGHDMLDGAIFAAGVHRLKNDQCGVLAFGVKPALKIGQPFLVTLQFLIEFLLGIVKRLNFGGPMLKAHFASGRNAKWVGVNVNEKGASQERWPASSSGC